MELKNSIQLHLIKKLTAREFKKSPRLFWWCSFSVCQNHVDLNQRIFRQSGYANRSSGRNTARKEACVNFVDRLDIFNILKEDIHFDHIGHKVVDTFHNCLDISQALSGLLFYITSDHFSGFRVQGQLS